jgi:trimethylamine:corrinoid methyltransferase-like protein
MGQLESEKTSSLEQLVIDNEIISYVSRFREGFEVGEKALATELIKEVGITGSYLETEQTLREFKAHLWEPRILNRSVRSSDAQPLEEVAAGEAQRLLNRGPKSPPSSDELAELRDIEKTFRKHITAP